MHCFSDKLYFFSLLFMINKVILIGNVGTEPEIRSLESGVKVARLRVATTERFTTNQGERREHTEWHTVILWRGQADFAERNIRKGTQIYVDGKIRSRERIDDIGGKRTYYEIHAEEVKTLGKREYSNPQEQPALEPVSESSEQPQNDIISGDSMVF